MGLRRFFNRHVTRRIARRIERWLSATRPPPEFPLSDYDRIRYELRPCDVLLVDGRSRVSDAIKAISQSPWSHAALYLGRLHDIEDSQVRAKVAEQVGESSEDQLLIESELGLGTVVRPLSVYADDHLRICRPKGLVMQDSQKIIAHAVSHLGKPYDIRHILDLARFLLPWSVLPRRWRSSLFSRRAAEATKTVCSTMIAEVFDAVDFPILPLVKRAESGRVTLYRRNPKLCTPSDFDYSPYFEIIKYPFWDITHHTGHRLSPMAQQGPGINHATDSTGLEPHESGVFLPAREEADAGAAYGGHAPRKDEAPAPADAAGVRVDNGRDESGQR